ncbi:YkvA family protein [Thalassobacillus devorans]|uniref:YkvA family protein n=1 Tax=Thalassobacillus devorans TaxID=279813 RepID=UPI0009FFC15F|nr:YkvA family protein [Thalassobacillus devorans]
MSEEKNYNKKLKNFNPAKAVETGRKYFSESSFFAKMGRYAMLLGSKIAYYSFLLYYTFKSPKTPKKDKLTIAGALGYLIFPADVIPDFIPVVGFADDSLAIIYAIYSVVSHIDESIKAKAHVSMVKYFGENFSKADIDERFMVDESKEDDEENRSQAQ